MDSKWFCRKTPSTSFTARWARFLSCLMLSVAVLACTGLVILVVSMCQVVPSLTAA